MAFIHLPAASSTLHYLPSFGGGSGKPGIELGKRTGQESCREAWEGEGACAGKSAIMTFGLNFKEKISQKPV